MINVAYHAKHIKVILSFKRLLFPHSISSDSVDTFEAYFIFSKEV